MRYSCSAHDTCLWMIRWDDNLRLSSAGDMKTCGIECSFPNPIAAAYCRVVFIVFDAWAQRIACDERYYNASAHGSSTGRLSTCLLFSSPTNDSAGSQRPRRHSSRMKADHLYHENLLRKQRLYYRSRSISGKVGSVTTV